MKHIFFALIAMLLAPLAFAIPPVTLSGPIPSINSFYSAGTSTTIIYTLKNNVPKSFPLTISGISGSVARTTVTNDCGNILPAAPASCNLGIMISPSSDQLGSLVNQTLQINYQGRTPLTSQISFTISQFAYVTVQPTLPPYEIGQYLVNPENGRFGAYTAAISSNTQGYTELVFATVGDIQYGYVTDQGAGIVYQCAINLDGGFNSCNSAIVVNPPWNPRGIAFTVVNGTQYSYVTDVNDGVVYQCTLNNSNGSFNTCAALNPIFIPSGNFAAPYGISFGVVNGLQYAFVADATGFLFQCNLDSNGAFATCQSIPASPPVDWVPYYAITKTFLGTQYIYVASNGGLSDAAAIYKCPLNSSNNCVKTPTITPAGNWAPTYLAFATFSGKQYAYIASQNASVGGAVYRCIVNNAGDFQDCEETGTLISSLSVAFRFS